MKKRIIAVMLAAAMTSSVVVTGCGNSSVNETETNTTNAGTDTSKVEETGTDLPKDLEWLTPFEDTVKLNVVIGWDADSTIKEGTTPETNSLVMPYPPPLPAISSH